MKVIEAMNELKLTERKLKTKHDFIRRYSARPSFREDALGGKERDKVAEAIQSCEDLIKYHENLKRRIAYTNLMATTDVNGQKYTLHSLILHKQLLCKLKRACYEALDDNHAQLEVSELRRKAQDPAKVNVQVVYNFDPMDREKKLAEISELETKIDSALQIANAKLDLFEPPAVG